MIDIEENEVYNFLNICQQFVESSRDLRDAAALCDDDPIKQDMISHIIPDFHKMWARSEGIKTLLEKENFSNNRKFVLDEMRLVIKENSSIAQKIRNKLGSLI
tara:strand:- start:203 stop:511 length:309 start_codon:yes stop_codon:yes gene_type:complete